jgi:bacillithiol system protein YtxJ
MRVLETVTDLDEAIARSFTHPVLIFKHSVTCGRSASAFEEVEDLMALEPAVEVFIVSVQGGARVSSEIARRFSLRHQSPQVLIVRDGLVAWHASHYGVTREEITGALQRSRSV